MIHDTTRAPPACGEPATMVPATRFSHLAIGATRGLYIIYIIKRRRHGRAGPVRARGAAPLLRARSLYFSCTTAMQRDPTGQGILLPGGGSAPSSCTNYEVVGIPTQAQSDPCLSRQCKSRQVGRNGPQHNSKPVRNPGLDGLQT